MSRIKFSVKCKVVSNIFMSFSFFSMHPCGSDLFSDYFFVTMLFCVITRKYRPLHMQSMTFPSLCYSGRFSPFESPPPPPFFDKQTGQKETKARFVKPTTFRRYGLFCLFEFKMFICLVYVTKMMEYNH